jgi:hypothetical protein
VADARPLDLNDIVGDVQRMLRRLIGENIELTVQPGAGLWRVHADRGQIEQVLFNLAANARDAMPQGGVLTIRTRNVDVDAAFVRTHVGATEGPHVQLEVTDTGVGMDAATARRIFEPFFTTKSAGMGSGLGLATVYGIVKRANGFIRVESAPGRGTAFFISLPRTDLPIALPVARVAVTRPLAGRRGGRAALRERGVRSRPRALRHRPQGDERPAVRGAPAPAASVDARAVHVGVRRRNGRAVRRRGRPERLPAEAVHARNARLEGPRDARRARG